MPRPPVCHGLCAQKWLTRFIRRVLTLLYIIFINTGPSTSVNPLSLWMKANGWSVTMIVSNILSFSLSRAGTRY